MSKRGTALFAAMCLIWGCPYLLIKVAVDGGVSPSAIVVARTALAILVLLPLAVRAGAVRPALRAWKPLLLFAGLEMCTPWFLLAHAEKDLSSSLTGLLIAGVPLVSAIAARALGEDDRLDRGRLIGLGIGLAGLAVLLGIDVRGDLLAVLAVGGVVIGYAIGPLVITRSLRDVPASGVNAVALAATGLVFLPMGGPDLVADPPPLDAGLALLGLGLVCTALALVLFFALIGEVGSQRALVITFVNPVVAVALGISFLDEPFTAGTAIGFPLVLLGCVLATRRNAAVVAAADVPVAAAGSTP
jgi:drug/metabolite transporter (DMT)-like permease